MSNKIIFADNLKRLMERDGKSRKDVCDALNLNYYTFTDWVNAKKYPRMDKVELLADYFNVTKSELIEEYSSNGIASPGTRRINVLGSIRAGIPTEAVEDIIDWEEIPEEMCKGGKEYFGLKVKGDSMWPDFLEGDVVIIQKTPVCNNGNICAVYVNGYDATLKQIKLGDDGSITLQPRNPSYPPRTYTKEEVEQLPVTIAGVVVELRRKFNF